MRATGRGVFPACSNETLHPDELAPPDGAARPTSFPVRPGARVRGLPARLSAVLAADVAAYSRHMAEDEAGTHARFMAVWCRVVEPVIAHHEGRTVKNTGDGFLAVFESATSAVRCAMGFQSAVRAWNVRRARGRPLLFRVGINLGDVIFEPHDVFGHSVNVAARLEAIAEPGGILVSHAVRVSVRDPAMCFEDVGELSLKNMTETVRGFRVQPRPNTRAHRQSAHPTAA